MEYVYLVSYHHSTGVGTAAIVRHSKINTAVKAEEVRSFIQKENGLNNVGIINFILLEKRWRKKGRISNAT